MPFTLLATSAREFGPSITTPLALALFLGISSIAALYLLDSEKRKKLEAQWLGVPLSPVSSRSSTCDSCMVVVDCFSTGAHVAKYAKERGYRVICVWSTKEESLMDLIPKDVDVKFDATFQLDTVEGMLTDLNALPWKIEAVIAGAETGVELADALSERLELRTNGTRGTLARRDKYVMGEAVRAAGLRAVEQAICSKLAEVDVFLTQHARFPVVLKPVDSGGTDGVTLCANREEARAAFKMLHGKVNLLGTINEAVLVQEFLAGTEYVVDTLSRDGQHKIAAIWEYDRRSGPSESGFVCYGQKLLECDTPLAKQLCSYQVRGTFSFSNSNDETS
jgi:biotin carboxylase